MTLTDPNAEAPTCIICGRDASAGYYDSRAEHHLCSYECYAAWAGDSIEVLAEFYKRMNLD